MRRATPTPGDDDLRRLERAARQRARRWEGRPLPGPEARATACEVCGGAGVRWGSLCEGCRARLRARLSGGG
jgi:hypothetical protein